MKTRSFIYALSTLALAGALMFTGCKKRKAFKEEDGQTSADSKMAQGESDAVNGDVNNVLGQSTFKIMGGRVSGSASAEALQRKQQPL